MQLFEHIESGQLNLDTILNITSVLWFVDYENREFVISTPDLLIFKILTDFLKVYGVRPKIVKFKTYSDFKSSTQIKEKIKISNTNLTKIGSY